MKICFTAITVILLLTLSSTEGLSKWRRTFQMHSYFCQTGLIYVSAADSLTGAQQSNTFYASYFLQTLMSSFSNIQLMLNSQCSSTTYASINASFYLMMNVTNYACSANNQPSASQNINAQINMFLQQLQQFQSQSSNQGKIYVESMEYTAMYNLSIIFNSVVSFCNAQAKTYLISKGYTFNNINIIKNYQLQIQTYQSNCKVGYTSKLVTLDKIVTVPWLDISYNELNTMQTLMTWNLQLQKKI